MTNTSPHAVNVTPLDGRGEGAPSAIGPRYLYYRPYQEDGAIESRSPAYSNDRFVGRILTKAVTPPHTTASLISHLCKIEGFSGSKNAFLYSSVQSQTVLEASARLALMSRSGPGSSEKEPMILLIKNAKKRSPGRPEASTGLPVKSANDTHYVHYRVYDKEGETASKTCFHEDATLGRINTLSVTPPFNAASLRACLARVEGVGANNLQLLMDLSSDSPMSDNDHIALLTDQYPGFTADEPMAFVCLDSAELPTSEPPKVDMQVKFKALKSYDASMDVPAWLPIRKGEILLSDGVEISREDYTGHPYGGYMVTNSAGKQGFVLCSLVTKS